MERGSKCQCPTCQDAGVEPGLVYDGIQEAMKDAEKLSKHNTIGFEIVNLTTEKMVLKFTVRR